MGKKSRAIFQPPDERIWQSTVRKGDEGTSLDHERGWIEGDAEDAEEMD